ncbi:hypothetical protein ZHAS_00010747 [Anopheles sinensis]|uniref:Uncharacterized protein n=1 Tax=Anopheles sinensis TaxID=74873 RepID=A0A084VYM3_ANOSI|nr:hypothetical protein ZHAS_00010747 [Anopheles sinensis]
MGARGDAEFAINAQQLALRRRHKHTQTQKVYDHRKQMIITADWFLSAVVCVFADTVVWPICSRSSSASKRGFTFRCSLRTNTTSFAIICAVRAIVEVNRDAMVSWLWYAISGLISEDAAVLCSGLCFDM